MPQGISSAQPDCLRRYADLLAAQGAQSGAVARRLADALGRLADTCREYRLGDVGGLAHRAQSVEGRDAELAGWARGVADTYAAADRNPLGEAASWIFSTAAGIVQARVDQEIRDARALVAEGQAAATTAARAIDWVSWNWAALRLRCSLATVDSVTWLSGDHLWGAGLGAYLAWPVLGPSLLDIGELIMWEDGPRWLGEPVDSPDDSLSLIEQGFWNLAFDRVAPGLLLSLASEIEELNRRTCADRDACENRRPPALAESDSSPQDVFPGARLDPATGTFSIPTWSVMDGGHSIISPYLGEQISMARIGKDEYLLAICGLDPMNMAVQPNGLVAVIQTATDDDPANNVYFRLAKARFLRYLEQIPPGSTLDVAGHSMGGGMSMLILNDPEVQAALVGGGYTLASVTTYGAVRPQDPRRNGIPPQVPGELAGELFAGTEVHHYVDREDRLAMNVGAGHTDDAGHPLPNVHIVDDGDLDGATTAHTSYNDPMKYAALPEALQALPFQVDPAYWELYRNPGSSDWMEVLVEPWWPLGEPPSTIGG